jgi:hypothetical protein
LQIKFLPQAHVKCTYYTQLNWSLKTMQISRGQTLGDAVRKLSYPPYCYLKVTNSEKEAIALNI